MRALVVFCIAEQSEGDAQQAVQQSWVLSSIISSEPGQLLVTAPDLCSKGCEFESQQEQHENFFLQS